MGVADVETDRSRPAGIPTQNRRCLLPGTAVVHEGTNQVGPVPIPKLPRADAAPLWGYRAGVVGRTLLRQTQFQRVKFLGHLPPLSEGLARGKDVL